MIKSLSAGMGVALMALLLPNALALNSSGLPAGMLTQLTPKTAIVMNPSQSGSLEKTSDQDSNTRNESTAAQGDGALIIHHQVFYLRRVTAYNALPSQTNSNPGMSACGPTRPDQIALSPDLFFRSNGSNRCGEKINIVLSSGKIIHGIVWDTMNPRYHMAADILMGSVQQAMDFGVRKARLRFVHSSKPTTSGV
ncbi:MULTISPECIES: hypothetical protein [Acidithiobacillus]|jgi:hypothetical protein|uniref:RlpA-like protein double-psi beta-barrel domain-containing protein n=1 Tax=Acidithiobacillus thiooxidans TaxID=930 RepID=A0A1C2JLL5_ACITH|nr:hypothetical protein [Acidithiobacillus thiooxidans]MDD2749887.1 hypothetical protein [Acidithiobacillus sp.]OCX74301.1 hypothetical protein A6P07_05705 [Acidithiobacillus thiooxidans]OCX75435.1 hypothetical protein A6M23_02770 [Acidithiobacillus thiooxidans]OCX78378.1 hypothetical protein A6O24_04465 [Acidithiobacillus thiooxidans]OCX84568.1 hypothetical protein A6O26_03925 [Acidithiobacillus thiooxidans]